jgi:hypothetical protein
MGLFCVNMHFRSTDDKALSAALERRGVTRFHIAPAKNGWTSLYEEQASQKDDRRIRDLAGGLSRDLQVAAIAFLVHDSDVACYWLFENGQLVDEYNSSPDYFDDDAADDEAPTPSGGRTDLLLRYCRPGVGQAELADILGEDAVFAEDVIGRLADALRIDRDRALADYRDVIDGGESDTGGDDDDDDEGPQPSPPPTGMLNRLATMFGGGGQAVAAEPDVQALVHAAGRDDVAKIDRLLAKGTAVDAEAPAILPGSEAIAGLGHVFPGGPPTIAMTPLLAAVMNKHRGATERLLDAKADPNRGHAIFGTAVHAAVGAGDAQLLQLLIDHGGDVNAQNPRGQTPLQGLSATRAAMERMAQAQAILKSMGAKLSPLAEQLAKVMPTEGWDECERLLRAHGAG